MSEAVERTRSARMAEIRSAALELFTQLGYPATTMADIGAAVGMKGPSLYKHVASKQDLLVDIMTSTMTDLLDAHQAAVATANHPAERLRRATEAHVRYHTRHRLEAFVGNRELRSLVEPHRSHVLSLRADYEVGFRRLVADGVDSGHFQVTSTRLASYAILDLGMGVSSWYRDDGDLSEDAVVWQYGELALRIVGLCPGASAGTVVTPPGP
ncbi:TetR/AcrR family transcriptional regulator [Phytoactinopolyspora limicola]|uniref:TetR/AcrR family transcriptional regulator n=1 Tax=Phytoactinopolyspora limicola TaxID=2715536 RepID=UPI001A9C6461|nr:TetR/AcrR family transcriptional regulator [Phytoactinopolyspora limicola]